MKIKSFATLLLLGSILMVGCRTREPLPRVESPVESEMILRQDNVAIYQLTCPEFDGLTPQLQRYAWHLTRACLAGRDILFDQTAPRSIEIRRLLDRLAAEPDLKEPFKTTLLKYAVKFWLANGNYDTETTGNSFPNLASTI